LSSDSNEPASSSAGEEAANRRPRVALVHYWLVRMRGGERVLERVLRLFPEADIFTHVYDPAAVSDLIRSRPVKTTFIDKFPNSRKFYQRYLPFMPLALEELDFSGYDLVISFEAGPAKGVITAPHTLHVCYCHSPMRYLWDSYGEYKTTAGGITRMVMALAFHRLRIWDVSTAARVDGFMSNSTFIQRRIEKFYRRDSIVVHPPVPVSMFRQATPDNYFLWVGHMTSYKRPDLAVDAFNRLGLPLLMVGDGPLYKSLVAKANSNVKIVPTMNFERIRETYSRARALVYTAEEDFGIIPVEALAAGRPVIAFGRGGVLDTLVDEATRVFFYEQSTDAVCEAVERFERWLPKFDPRRAIAAAAQFSPERFDQAFTAAVRKINNGRSPAVDRLLDQVATQPASPFAVMRRIEAEEVSPTP
jgi:glycosyltransferase involved in cell wall biosynthesis